MTTNETHTRQADSPSTLQRDEDRAPSGGAFTARDMALSLVAVAVGWLLHYHMLG